MGYQNEPISYSRIWTGKIKKGAEAFDGKSQTGHCKERPSGPDQHGHAGLYPEVFEAAHQQSS